MLYLEEKFVAKYFELIFKNLKRFKLFKKKILNIYNIFYKKKRKRKEIEIQKERRKRKEKQFTIHTSGIMERMNIQYWELLFFTFEIIPLHLYLCIMLFIN